MYGEMGFVRGRAVSSIHAPSIWFAAVLATVLATAAWSAEGISSLDRSRDFLIEGDYKSARKMLEELIEKNPNDAAAHLALAQLLLIEEEKIDPTIQQAEMAVRIDDGSARNHLWLGRALAMKAQKSGRLEDAVGPAKRAFLELERAVVLDSTDVRARGDLATLYLGAPDALGGNIEKAKSHAEVLRARGSVSGYILLAMCIANGEGEEKAVEYLRREVPTDTTRHAKYALGQFYYYRKKFPEAATVFREILDKDPNDTVASYGLGRVYLVQKEDLDEAISCFKRFLDGASPTDRTLPTWAGAHCRLGAAYELQGKKQLALEEFRQAVRMEPDNLEFRKELRKRLK